MSNPYTQPSLSGYNANPPADDGSEVATNALDWDFHIDKIGDPIKTFAQAIDTNVNTAFGKIFGQNITSQGGNYTVLSSDQGKFIEVTAAATITLVAAATAGSGFAIAIVNTGSGTVTVDGSGAETINGAATISLLADEAAILTCDGSVWIAAIAHSEIADASDTAAGKVEIAVQSEMETASSTTLCVTPGRQHYHPSAAKVWGYIDRSAGTPSLSSPSYNIDSVTDDGAGQTIVTIDTDFSTAVYAVCATLVANSTSFAHAHTLAAGSFKVRAVSDTGSATDTADYAVAAFGDQ